MSCRANNIPLQMQYKFFAAITPLWLLLTSMEADTGDSRQGRSCNPGWQVAIL